MCVYVCVCVCVFVDCVFGVGFVFFGLRRVCIGMNVGKQCSYIFMLVHVCFESEGWNWYRMCG